MAERTPEEYAHLERFGDVSTSTRLVCTGESGGQYNYDYIDNVYPREKPFISVKSPHGPWFDLKPNPNYRPKR